MVPKRNSQEFHSILEAYYDGDVDKEACIHAVIYQADVGSGPETNMRLVFSPALETSLSVF